MNTLRLRWLFFDLGNTIWRSSTPESRRAAGLYAKVGDQMRDWLAARGHRPPKDGASLAEQVWGEVDATSKLAEGTSAVEADPAAAVKRILLIQGVSVSLEDSGALWQFINAASAPERGITPLDGAASTLGTLKAKGLRLGVITNRTLDTGATRRDLACFGLDGYFEHVDRKSVV
jgi:FMN phosphatase YigB (HAD superfamily)